MILVRFSPDGTFAKDWRGLLDTSPAAAGTYELDGAAVTFASSRSDVCTEGDQWAWDAGIPEEGRLSLVWTESPADECFVGPGSQWSLTRVSPSSPASAEIAGEPGEDPVPPQDETTVAGIWLLEGTGRLLRLGEDRSYATDEAGALGVDPADGGRFQLDDGTITFTSGEGSNACEQGDEWVWERAAVAASPQVRPDPEAGEGGLAQPGDWTLQAEVTEDGCGHAVGDEPRWLRLSP